MAELARGNISDRPWGRTLAAFGLRGVSGQLTLTSDGKRYEIVYAQGAIVGASSPLAADSAARVAMTGGLVSTTQVAELVRRQAAAPHLDEFDVLTDHLRLSPEQALRLRRRTIALRAARTFSVDRGDFVVADHVTLPIVAGTELDVRAVIYLGARQNFSENRLGTELATFGSWYRLKPQAFVDLPQFGFADTERPVLDALLNGASIAELDLLGVEPRTVRAVAYALAACSAVNVQQTHAEAPATTSRSGIGGASRSSSGLAGGAGSGKPQPPPMRQQPLVAYRPGKTQPPPMRRTGQTQPPPPAAGPIAGPAPTTLLAAAPGTRRSGLTQPPPLATATAGLPTARPITGVPATARTTTGTPATGPATPGAPTPGRTPTGAPVTARTTTNTPATARTTTNTPAMGRASTGTLATGRTPTATGRPAPPLVPAMPVGGRGKSTTVPPNFAAGTERAGKHADPAQLAEVQRLVDERMTLLGQRADHYAMIGVSPDATAEVIRKAYFALARQLHPDRLAALKIADDGQHAHKVVAQLNAAFSVLSDPKRRAEYDEQLDDGGASAQKAEADQQAEEMAIRILQAEEIFRRGEQALKRDDLNAAITEFKRAIDLNPDEADFHAMHAWASFCASADKSSVAHPTRMALERAIERSPKAINPRFYLGRVERMLGHDQAALVHFRHVLTAKPNHYEAQGEVRVIEARIASGGTSKPGGGLFGRKR